MSVRWLDVNPRAPSPLVDVYEEGSFGSMGEGERERGRGRKRRRGDDATSAAAAAARRQKEGGEEKSFLQRAVLPTPLNGPEF